MPSALKKISGDDSGATELRRVGVVLLRIEALKMGLSMPDLARKIGVRPRRLIEEVSRGFSDSARLRWKVEKALGKPIFSTPRAYRERLELEGECGFDLYEATRKQIFDFARRHGVPVVQRMSKAEAIALVRAHLRRAKGK